MSPIANRARLPLALLAIVSGLLLSLGAPGPRPSALSDARKAPIDRKLAAAVDRRFDQPAEAAAFYANRRTGPILTRGANVTTGIRPLSPSAYFPALQQMRSMPRYSTATSTVLPSYAVDPDLYAAPGAALGTWTSLGPSNQGGRTRAMLINPDDPNIMYAGGVAGGVWRTTDAGANWTPLGDLAMANLAVVSLAFDPASTSTIYAGTGEGFFNADAIRGAGIFKSTDAGVTWNQLPATNTSNFFYVNSLVVSPRNTLRMFAATRTGLFRSIDGGASWTNLVAATAVNGCTQVALQTSGVTGFVFGSCGNFAQGTVHRLADDDVSTASPVLSLAAMARSSIAIAPSNQAVVYVMADRTGSAGLGADSLHGIYRSAANGDAGSFTTQVDGAAVPATFQQTLNRLPLTNPVIALLTECGFGTSANFNQGWYDNVIAVDPLDPNRVWAGGIDLFRSDDGGVNWGTAGFWWFTKGVDPEYHHADQHGIVFHPQFNGTSNKVMFSLSDGGVERIDDARAPVNTTLTQVCGTPVAGGATWIDRNNGYATTQFYDGTPYPDGQTYFGGLQDNGTQRGTSAGSLWSTLLGGDGGYVAVDTLGDAVNANDVLFAENTGLSIQRSLNGGASFNSAVSGIGDAGFMFISPFTMNPVFKQHLWTGGFFIWRTTNQATSWTRASAITAGTGSVAAVAAHPLDPDRVIVGMSDGFIHANQAALSATSVTVWPSTRPSTAYVSSVVWDPTNINVAYATISAFNTANIFKSVNAGATWSPIVGSGATALPQIPALSVVVNPDDPLQVYVGTDLGVFTSVDGGTSWFVENTGFARVPVEALKVSATAPTQLFAFTHGRGAWRVAPAVAGLPVAANDGYATPFQTQLNVSAPGVLANDDANGGGAMTAQLVSSPLHGGLALSAIGSFTYTPAAGFSGTDTFTYRAVTGAGPGGPATVTITVGAPAIPPPTSANDTYNGTQDSVLTVAAPGVLANDNSNGGGVMTSAVVSTTSSGSLSLAADGSFTYTPNGGFSGVDTFTYRASNASGPGNVATVSIHVAVPTGPVAPSNFRILAMAGNAVTFAWTLPTAGPTPTAIRLEGGFTPGSVLGALPLGVTPSATVALPTGSFFIRLRTIAGGATSGPSNELLVHVNVPLPPSAPANLLGLVNGSAVQLAWTPTFGGGAPTGALLDVSGTLSTTLPLGAGDTFAYPTVPPGTYTFQVRQTSAGGASPPSSPVTLTFPGGCSGAPQAATNFVAYKAAGVLYLHWDPPASGAAPSAYALTVTGSFVGSFPMGGRSFRVTAPPGTFTLSIVAINPCGASAPTATATVSFP